MTTHTYKQDEGLPIFKSEDGGDEGLPIFNQPHAVKKKETSGSASTTNILMDGSFDLTPEQIQKYEQSKERMNKALGFTEESNVSINEDPIKYTLRPYRQKAIESYKNLKLLSGRERQPSESTNQGVRVGFQNQLQQEHQNNAEHLQEVQKKVYNTVFPNGKVAEDYLRGVIKKNNGKIPEENETANVAITKAGQYELLKQRIANEGDLTQLAVNLYRENDPHLDKQISLLEKEKGINGKVGSGLDTYRNVLPPVMQGRLIDELLKDPNIDIVASENPGLKEQVDRLRNGGLYESFPEYAQAQITNEISRAREHEGGNNWFANPIFNSSKYLDNLADRLYANDSIKRKFVDEHLKGNWEGKIDTPGFMDEFGTGAKEAYKGMFGTLKDISGFGLNEAERTEENLKKQYESVSSEATRLHKTIGTAGNFLGMIGAMGSTGTLFRGAGLSPAMANRIMVGTTFYDQELNDWTNKYPGEPWKAQLGAIISTGAFMALPDINPSSKVAESIQGKMREEIAVTLKSMEERTVNKAALANDLTAKFQNVLKETAKGTAKGVAEMTAITAFKTGLDQALGLSEKDQQVFHPSDEIIDVAKSMLIGGALPHFISAYGNRNAISEGLYSIASNPDRYKSVLQLNNDPLLDRKFEDIDFLTKTKQELDAEGISEKEQKRYLLEALQEKYAKRNAHESSLAKLADENITIHRNTKDKILKKEPVEDLPADRPFKKEEPNIVKEFFENDLIPSQDKPMISDEKGNFKSENSDEYLKYISEQAQGIDASGNKLEGGGREKDMIDQGYPKELIEAAKEKYPANEKIPVSEPVSETVGGATETNEPAKTSEATEIPPSTPEGPKEAIPSEQGEERTIGIRHESLRKIADRLGLEQPQRGTFLTPEEQIKRGRMLLQGGANPEKVAADFREDGKVNSDDISVARAHFENLTKEAQSAFDKYGKNSEQYAKAKLEMQKWRDEVIKPMGTASGGAFSALQGETDLDTGSFVSMQSAKEENQGKPITPEQEKKIGELTGEVQRLSKEVDDLKLKLTETLDKETELEKPKNYRQKAKDLAKKLREQAKLSRPGSFSAATPASLVWDGAVEVVAKSIEAGGEIAQAVADGINYIKESEWYKGLKNDEKKNAEEEFRAWHEENSPSGDIRTRFVDKKDNKFTSEEAKEIWDYAKENYLDKGSGFDQMISGTAVDLGLRTDQVRDALTTPKGTKQITDAMYKKQNERNMAIQRAKDWANAAKSNGLVKFLKAIPRFFFAAKVFGHGTVGMVTHSGINVYDPVEWKRYWPVFFKQFKFAYGSAADYEKAMQDVKNDPQFIFWKRNGLAVDPSERYDEYQFITNMFNKMGKVGRWLTAGDRGFNALKVYRLMRAKALWENLSEVEKADRNTPKELAKLVNHSTGTTGLKVSEVAQTAFFAPNLELARWNKLIVDPAKAVKTFTNWKEATPAEKAAAKIVAKRAGRILATYVGALAVNQGLLSLSGSNQKINFTNPMDSDWLKFKAGGRTLDMTGGMVSILGFLTRMAHTATASSSDLKNKSRKDELMNQGWSYVSGKLSPFASTTKDVVTRHDFQGNTLPFYNDEPLHSWNHKMSYKEYFEKQQTPIPVAEFFTDLDKQLKDEGIKKPQAGNILQSLFAASLVGGTGVHIGEEPENKQESFNDPIFKYFTDKGLNIPSTSPSSEIIKDKKTYTKKKLSDYPKEVIEEYQYKHKDNLKSQLEKIKQRGYVYIDRYGDIHIDHVPASKRINMDDLSKEQLTEVLHLSQSSATQKTKDKMF